MDILQNRRTTIASYPGGKSDVKKHLPLYRNIPRINTVVEPFAGLANFSIITSPISSKIYLNDRDPYIYSLLKIITEKELLQKLITEIRNLEFVEREDYYEWKRKTSKDPVEMAMKQLVILNCSVNAAGGGYSKDKAHRQWYRRKEKVWLKIHDILTSRDVEVFNMDYTSFLDSLSLDDQTLVYLDPPYFEVAKSGNLYGTGFNSIDASELSKKLDGLDCHWIMSNRYSPETEEMFSSYYTLKYNTYNDMNNRRGANPELLVSNYQLI